MDNYCLNRNEIIKLIEHKIQAHEIDEELKEYIERAELYWDINLISSNCFLSIILEQKIRRNDCEKEFLDSFYELQDKMSFHIEELRPDFIDFIYNYKMPNKQNAYIAALIEARKHKDEEKVNTIKEKINCAFEEDLILSIQDYYDKIYD